MQTAQKTCDYAGAPTWVERPDEFFLRCKNCGSIRFDDAIGLLKLGWTGTWHHKRLAFELKPHPIENISAKNAHSVLQAHLTTAEICGILGYVYGGFWVREGDWYKRLT